MKSERLQIVLPSWLKESLKLASEAKGISMSEFIKDALKEKLERKPSQRKTGGG